MKKIFLLSVFAAMTTGCTVIPPTPGVYLQSPVVIGQPQVIYQQPQVIYQQPQVIYQPPPNVIYQRQNLVCDVHGRCFYR